MGFHKTVNNGNIVRRDVEIYLFFFLGDGVIDIPKPLYKLANLF